MPTWGTLITLLVHLVPGESFVNSALTMMTMTIRMMRIKPARTTSHHLRASVSPSSIAMTSMMSTRLEEQTIMLNSCFLCLLLNKVSHAFQIVFSNSIFSETYRSTTTKLSAATVIITVAATTTNLATATATTAAKASTTDL
jgi:hypothetical protein